jgi:hypothetical protein
MPNRGRQRLVVDRRGADGLLEGQQAREQHQRRADQGDAGAVHAQARHLADSQAGVGQGEQGGSQP